MLESTAHLTSAAGESTSPQKTQHIWTSEAANGVMQKSRIKDSEILSLLEEQIGSVLCFRGAPIVTLTQRSTNLGVQGMGLIEQLSKHLRPIRLQLLIEQSLRG